MKPETFFDNFDVLAEAPNGVQKLRELILQLAVRGKLVAQDEKDEPANNLLKRIKNKKEQLIKENKIKNIEPLAPINKNEVPCILSEGWEWAHIGDLILSITGGGTPSKNNPQFWNGNIPWASVKDLGKSKYLETTIDFITEKGIQNSSTNLIPKGRVIICTRMGLGKIVLNKIDVAINQDLKAIELPEEFNENYFYNFYITQNIKGSGMTVSGIRQTELLNMLVPVPPLAEQHRIVAKVDQLMSLCDKLEARQQKKRESRARLNSAALDRLLAARAPGEFAEGWRRIYDNFDLLYDAPENVGALRQAILQLAVMGKLVAQDERDEPAGVLMERIYDENKIQIENQKNKKTPLFSPIRVVPFDLPKNWKWCRMGEIAEIMMGNSPPGDSYNENGNGIPLINGPVEFSKGPFGYTNKSKFTTKPTKLCEENDLLICVRGSTTGRTNIAGFQACIGRGVAAIRARIHQQYVNYLVLSMRQQIYDLGTGSTFPSVSYGQLNELPIPLPPLAEQRRIVARVDQLMSLCDKLEAGLMRSQADSEKLMEAVVGRMLAE